MTDRYGSDVLSTDWRAPKRGRAVEAPATLGEVVEEVTTDFCGEIVAVDRDLGVLTLEDRRGTRRTFPLGPGFLLEGRPVVLVPPVTQRSTSRTIFSPQTQYLSLVLSIGRVLFLMHSIFFSHLLLMVRSLTALRLYGFIKPTHHCAHR